MKIKNQLDTLFFAYFFDIILNGKDLRMLIWISFQPASIKVKPSEVSSIVSQYNSVYINHWNHVNIEPPSKEVDFYRMP
jgi:hypothetical protein